MAMRSDQLIDQLGLAINDFDATHRLFDRMTKVNKFHGDICID
jgi:hypothetical protein